jgi:hypothetical protein
MGDSLVAKSFKVFRLTAAPDTPNTDFILFNDPAAGDFKDTAKEGAYLLTLSRGDPEGIGNNQAAEKPDGNVQPLGIVEGTYQLKGFISNMRGNADDGNNAFTATLRTWKEEAQAILGVWEAGRFGFIDESDSDNTFLPIGTGDTAVGLIFENFDKVNDYNRNRIEITLTFRRSRGLDI